MYQNMRNYARFEGNVGTAAASIPGRDGKPFVKFSMAVDNSYQDKSTGQWVKGSEQWVTVKLNSMKSLELVGKVEVGDRVIVEGMISTRQYEFGGQVRFELCLTCTYDGIIIRNKKADRGRATAAQLAEVPTPTNAPTDLVVTGHDPNGLL